MLYCIADNTVMLFKHNLLAINWKFQ